ncbi:MAG: UDP-N-acetylmuramate--L-alanine ligase [Sphingomonadales bacterium]
MRKVPFDIGTVHFTGIGGIGMSGIAEVMHNLGYKVQGSDISENANVKRLKAMGIEVSTKQKGENVENANVIVVSTAIKKDNPEVIAAREKMIPVVPRSEMLAELMRLKWCVSIAGTHGKTTTTSMMAMVLDASGFDPTVINGGIINAYGTNARIGAGDWMVVEADESDGTFVRLPATVAIVTNIDPEHLDYWGTFGRLKEAFATFVEGIPFYGVAVLCIDHPEVQALIPEVSDRKIITYGFLPEADVRIVNESAEGGTMKFDIITSDRLRGGTRTIEGLVLNMPGRHNVQNAAAAIAAGLEMGVAEDALRQAFKTFSGVKRRFTKTGIHKGITVIDDYAHHPVEISAVLKAGREIVEGRIIAVVQPHRYTRLSSLFEEFCLAFGDADEVVVAPVYEAGEKPIKGITHKTFAESLRGHGHRHVHTIETEEDLGPLILKNAVEGDLVICLGAGSITAWANRLPKTLANLDKSGGGV